jgi:hypothetical protein
MRSVLSPERTRACLALAAAWAAVAVVLGAYAIGRESVGALLLAILVTSWMRLAWVSAWQDAESGDER